LILALDRRLGTNGSKLKRVKKETMSWAHNKRILDEHELVSTEAALSDIYASEGGGFLSQETKEALITLEKKKRVLLEAKEEVWRKKILAIWLASGDENTKFFRPMLRGEKVPIPFGA
jgi:hypothetical protein